MEKETFDYSMVPNNFSLCTEQDCPNADTCLRRIAYDHVPASITFLSILNPKANKEATRKKCQHYSSNEKVRYAKGFVRTTGVLTVNAASTFRYKLIATWGIRRYYQKRKGETLLSPVEQLQVISLAQKLGIHQEEYFDNYIEEYKWHNETD